MYFFNLQHWGSVKWRSQGRRLIFLAKSINPCRSGKCSLISMCPFPESVVKEFQNLGWWCVWFVWCRKILNFIRFPFRHVGSTIQQTFNYWFLRLWSNLWCAGVSLLHNNRSRIGWRNWRNLQYCGGNGGICDRFDNLMFSQFYQYALKTRDVEQLAERLLGLKGPRLVN